MRLSRILMAAVAAAVTMASVPGGADAQDKELVYLTPGLDLPFWRYLSKGVEAVAVDNGYSYQALDSRNSAQTQRQNAQDAIARGVDGIIISPTDSSTAPSSPRPMATSPSRSKASRRATRRSSSRT